MALNDRTKIVNLRIEDEMKTSYINYSMSVIVSRALPASSRRSGGSWSR